MPFFLYGSHRTGIFEDGTHKGQVSERFDPSCVSIEVSSLKPMCSAGVTTHVVGVFITSYVFLDNDTQVL